MGQRHPEVLRQQPRRQPQGRRPHAPLRLPQRPAQEWTLSSGSVTAQNFLLKLVTSRNFFLNW